MSPPARLDIDVRCYSAADREGVRALMLEAFGSTHVFDQFDGGNPLGEPVSVVAVHAGRVVGFNTWNPWIVHAPQGPVVAYQSGASAVAESMRGQGIFGKLLRFGEDEARRRDIAVLFGFPNPASLPGFLKAAWEERGRLRLYASPAPSVGIGPLGLRTSSNPPATAAAAAFVAWRFARAGVVGRRLRLRGGRDVTVYARTERHRGAAVNKLLDVVDADGCRVSTGLGAFAARLPGPGVTMLRATVPPGGFPPWLHLRREWDTPVIVKRLRTDDPLAGATFWYGDIDAS